MPELSQNELWPATAFVDHTDRIGAFDGLTAKGLTCQRPVCRAAVEVGGVTEPEVQHEVGIPITVHILLVTATLVFLFTWVSLAPSKTTVV